MGKNRLKWLYRSNLHFIHLLFFQNIVNLGVKAPKILVFELHFMRKTTVLRSFLAFLVKEGTLEGPTLTEMIEQKDFTLY